MDYEQYKYRKPGVYIPCRFCGEFMEMVRWDIQSYRKMMDFVCENEDCEYDQVFTLTGLPKQ